MDPVEKFTDLFPAKLFPWYRAAPPRPFPERRRHLLYRAGSPRQNGYDESFHSRLLDECLARKLLDTLAEAQTMITRWRHTDNHCRPHSSRGSLPPAQFASQCTAETFTQPVLS